jgi:hypothetical protein
MYITDILISSKRGTQQPGEPKAPDTESNIPVRMVIFGVTRKGHTDVKLSGKYFVDCKKRVRTKFCG